MNDYVEIKCLEVKQPIGTFLIGSISAQDLIEISFADVRRPEGREIEKYIGLQRDLSDSRVEELKKYVKTIDACFPTSVILSIDPGNSDSAEPNAIYEAHSGILKIRKDKNVAKIIDGQHRIAGLADYSGVPFDINITIFLDMDLEDQAMVFATINLKQTKVSKSLAYDLYDFAKLRSPQKTSHNIAKLMNFKEDSPLKGRIKILGKASGGDMERITQATFVDYIIQMISKRPMEDKDLIKRGKSLVPAIGHEINQLIFRSRFIEEKDAEIAKILWNYFGSVAVRWPTAWTSLERGMILSRTTGFVALIKLLPQIMLKLGGASIIPSQELFLAYFLKIPLQDTDFTSDRFKPGSSGVADLRRALVVD